MSSTAVLTFSIGKWRTTPLSSNLLTVSVANIWEPEITDDFKSYHLDLKFPGGDTDENAAARLQIKRIWDINPWDRNMYGLGRLSVDAHNPTVRADADLEGRGDLDAG